MNGVQQQGNVDAQCCNKAGVNGVKSAIMQGAIFHQDASAQSELSNVRCDWSKECNFIKGAIFFQDARSQQGYVDAQCCKDNNVKTWRAIGLGNILPRPVGAK